MQGRGRLSQGGGRGGEGGRLTWVGEVALTKTFRDEECTRVPLAPLQQPPPPPPHTHSLSTATACTEVSGLCRRRASTLPPSPVTSTGLAMYSPAEKRQERAQLVMEGVAFWGGGWKGGRVGGWD